MPHKIPLSLSDRPHLSRVLPELWSHLQPTEQEQLTLCARCYSYKSGERVYQSGEQEEEVYILAEGQVKLVYEYSTESPRIMQWVGPSEFFGIGTLFAGRDTSLSGYTTTSCLIYRMPAYVLQELITHNSAVSLYFIRCLSDLLLHSYSTTQTLTRKHLRGRLAESLLYLAERFGIALPGSGQILLTQSRTDISQMCSMSRSNVYRTLRSFEVEGLLRVEGKGIIILDFELLRKASLHG